MHEFPHINEHTNRTLFLTIPSARSLRRCGIPVHATGAGCRCHGTQPNCSTTHHTEAP